MFLMSNVLHLVAGGGLVYKISGILWKITFIGAIYTFKSLVSDKFLVHTSYMKYALESNTKASQELRLL